ncbi:hypothetical protein Q5Y75_24785 [Ruegeria sp. 2205SS24-7]|uniref:hypothetical protein n=1 Tax=Ruegeria discodermiae TaxID=3064389 RepID=UPI0027407E97|nr:hypothetical protein [Ruegeria sp. 2205SS24-7]MDP5220407.1 hypothetical protein [Ruegeria sp. 2205SS24-7]
MRLIFIHGINNEDNSSESIATDWWTALVEGWQAVGLPIPGRPEIDVGYYAKILAASIEGRDPRATAQGATAETESEARAFLDSYMQAANITNEELAEALAAEGTPMPEVVEQGLIGRGLVASAGALERILRNRGQWIASGFLPQATQYIEDRGLAREIAVTVRKEVFDGKSDPAVVVAHSLGTVVAYDLLASDRLSERTVPLFMTLGSPLAIGMMQQILPPKSNVPNPPIGRWTNAYRKEDPVALGRGITKKTMDMIGVENIHEGLVAHLNPHSIQAYLQSPPVCVRIHTALTHP